MDKDTQTSSNPEVKTEQAHQNRRQFFNSLGKWSLAVVAAVTAFPEDFHLIDLGIARKPIPPQPSDWHDRYVAHGKTYQGPLPQKPGKSKTPGGTPPGLEEPLEKKGS